MSNSTCRCDKHETPESLWGYCEDDWYCPQCGERLCWITSTEEYLTQQQTMPDGERLLWVYPSHNGLFLVRLFLHRPSHDRKRVCDSPNVERVALRGAAAFDAQILPPTPGQATAIVLIPRAANAQLVIPKNGQRCTLHLNGDFPPTHFDLLICRSPRLRWSLSGRGIRRNDAVGHSEWLVQRREWLQLELRLISEDAPIKLLEAASDNLHPAFEPLATPPQFTLLKSPAAGEEVSVGHPGIWRLRVDCRSFGNIGQILRLSPAWPLVGSPGDLPPIELQYVPAAVTFEPHELSVSQMFWGEVRSNDWSNRHENPDDPGLPPVVGEVLIRNDGEKTIKLKRPDTQIEQTVWGLWLHSDWLPSAQADEHGFIEIPARSTATIMVRLDFQGSTADRPTELLDPGPRGTVRVAAVDGTDFWEITVQVGRLSPRTPCPFPLAIDFGNSFSYAAVCNEGLIPELPAPVLAVHDRTDPEAFPTLLRINRWVPEAPLKSDFVIGRAANELSLSEASELWSVSDLKRWLGHDNRDEDRPIVDAGQITHYVRLSTLVQMYLFGLVQHAEAILRRYFITEIVTSYPAKMPPHARRHYLGLVDELCDQLSEQRKVQNQEIKHRHALIDEANAVATGFVLSNPQNATEVAELGIESFVVVSFDFGGGSLDTATLRFQVDNPGGAVPSYTSEYLGIGGQSDFGGDNVTIAVMELLHDRIAPRLATRSIPETLLDDLPLPRGHQKTVGVKRAVYDALWNAAEWCKRSFSDPITIGSAKWQFGRVIADPLVVAFVDVLQSALLDPQFRPTLDEVCRHSIRSDHHGKKDYTVEQRLNESVAELSECCQRHCVTPTFIVLGGGGSRFPSVHALLKRQFPDAQLVFDPQRLKSLVAEGLVRTVDYLANGGQPPPGQYTNRSLGVLAPGMNTPFILIPVCSHFSSLQHFPLEHNGRPIAPQQVARQNRLTIYSDVEKPGLRRPVGDFNLSKSTFDFNDRSHSPKVTLCFAGDDETSLQLHLKLDEQSDVLQLEPTRQSGQRGL